ncbi:MAG: DUF4332 domain-containing protein [Candidatus Thorarchaeota archaeon]|jgi:hypothetical protein
MEEEAFRIYLKRIKKSKTAIESIIELVCDYEGYLLEREIEMTETLVGDLENYVLWVEENTKEKANKSLWALTIYYNFIEQEEMARLASFLRGKRIKPKPFPLSKFRGVNQEYVSKLEQIGIINVEQMIERGSTPEQREKIASELGVPQESILEFVKLSDLTRIGAVRTVRARLYHDSGVDTIEKVAKYTPEDLRTFLQTWIEESGFEGIAPLPKEAANAVRTAKKLPRLVDYE